MITLRHGLCQVLRRSIGGVESTGREFGVLSNPRLLPTRQLRQADRASDTSPYPGVRVALRVDDRPSRICIDQKTSPPFAALARLSSLSSGPSIADTLVAAQGRQLEFNLGVLANRQGSVGNLVAAQNATSTARTIAHGMTAALNAVK